MTDTSLGRRQLLARAGAVGALGALWGTRADARSRPQTWRWPGHVVLDVACLGYTFAPFFGAALSDEDMRGASFFVEGNIYRARTIPNGPDWDPASADAIGHWFCRGWFIFHPDRPLPHVITTQEYVLGTITDDQPSPPDTLHRVHPPRRIMSRLIGERALRSALRGLRFYVSDETGSIRRCSAAG